MSRPIPPERYTWLVARLGQLLKDAGWPGNSFDSAVDAWEGFVAECQQGYGMNIYEYDNDIYCRDVVEAVLQDPELREAEELEDFRERVGKADRAFQALALDGVYRGSGASKWWRRVILRQAGRELANDLRNESGVAVETVDDGPKLP